MSINLIKNIKKDTKELVKFTVLGGNPRNLQSFIDLNSNQFRKIHILIKILNAHLNYNNQYSNSLTSNNINILNKFRNFYGNSLENLNRGNNYNISLITKFIISDLYMLSNSIKTIKNDIKKLVKNKIIHLNSNREISTRNLQSFEYLSDYNYNEIYSLVKILNAFLEGNDNYVRTYTNTNTRREILNNFRDFSGNYINNNINFNNIENINRETSSKIKLITKFIILNDKLIKPVIDSVIYNF
jgi:hypothetical protein